MFFRLPSSRFGRSSYGTRLSSADSKVFSQQATPNNSFCRPNVQSWMGSLNPRLTFSISPSFSGCLRVGLTTFQQFSLSAEVFSFDVVSLLLLRGRGLTFLSSVSFSFFLFRSLLFHGLPRLRPPQPRGHQVLSQQRSALRRAAARRGRARQSGRFASRHSERAVSHVRV